MKSGIVLLIGLALCGAARDAVAQTDSVSVAQAERGHTAFRSVCVNCHTTSQFTGSAFAKKWVGRTVFDVFEQIRTTMPQDNPGALPREHYLAVVAYVLKLNGSPLADVALPDDVELLKRIVIPPAGNK